MARKTKIHYMPPSWDKTLCGLRPSITFQVTALPGLATCGRCKGLL